MQSSSLVEVEVRVKVEVGAEVEVGVKVEVGTDMEKVSILPRTCFVNNCQIFNS